SKGNRLLELPATGKDASGGDLQLGAAAHVELLDGLPCYREVLVGLVGPALLGKDAGQHGGEVSSAGPLPRSLKDLQTGPQLAPRRVRIARSELERHHRE